jgi:ferredoxin--NADP+ reductase
MIEDLAAGKHFEPTKQDVSDLVEQRQPAMFTYADWLKLAAMESAKGEANGRPRVKFTSVNEMEAALGK